MENNTPSIKPIAINYGILLALASVFILVITYVANMEQHWVTSVISLTLTVLIFWYAIQTYKKANNNYLSLGESLKVGLATAAIAGVLSAVYTYVHYSFVNPEFITTTMDNARIQMLETNPNMTEEQMNMSIGMAEKFTSPFMFATFSLIGTLFMGFLVSLILGLILKNKNPDQGLEN